MKPLVVLLAAFLVAAPEPSAYAQTVRTVAIADFEDQSIDGIYIGAGRMNSVLERILTGQAGARLRVVSSDAVRAAMRAQRVTAYDLISPTKAIAIAQAVGAEWIVTGRWTRLEAERVTIPSPVDPDRDVGTGLAEAIGVIDIRVLEAATRRIVLQQDFWSAATGPGRTGALWQVAQLALLRAAERILTL